MNSAVEKMQRLFLPTPHHNVTGEWFKICLSPNVASGERLNIGVAFVEEARQTVHARLIEELDKLGPLYGEGFEDQVLFLAKTVRHTLSRCDFEPPSPNITYSERKFAAGESPQEIVERIFSAVVSLFSPAEPQPARLARATSFTNDQVRKHVFEAMKRRAGLAADRIIAEDPVYLVKEQGKTYAFDLPLRMPDRLGTIVSAGYRTPVPLENNLLRASLDLETAKEIFRRDRLGFFVLRPGADSVDFGPEHLLQIDNVIDVVGWKLHKQGVHIGVEDSHERLADEVLAWAA